jgi:ATP-dependent Clp protease ATP-binding subunit ClpA
MLSRNLERTLHRALAHANERRHEYATLEHLLLGLTEDQDSIAVFHACEVDLDKLRGDLVNYLDHDLASLISAHVEDAKPTASFQRVLQRAAVHVQSSGREEITGANVLVAMFSERESHAVHFLQEQEMTRFDAVNYLSHGIPKPPVAAEGLSDRADAALHATIRASLLGDKAAGVSPALIAQAKRLTGIGNTRQVIEFALASLTLEGRFAQIFEAVRGTVDPTLDLGG